MSVSAFANEDVNSIDLNTEQIIQSAANETGVDVKVEQLSKENSLHLWEQSISQDINAKELFAKLNEENYAEQASRDSLAVKISDKDRPSLYSDYFFKAYENDQKETVLAMFVYVPQTRSVLLTSAKKIGNDGVVSAYYDATNKTAVPRQRDAVSFICGLSGTFACSAFSAMIFAFPIASILVGASCGAIFDYVCSR